MTSVQDPELDPPGRRSRVVGVPLVGYAAAGVTLGGGLLLAAVVRAGADWGLVVPVLVLGVGAAVVSLAVAGAGRGMFGHLVGLRKDLLAQMVPVICLGLAYPLVGDHLASLRVGNVTESQLLLAASLAVPWLSQIVCVPLFMALCGEPALGEPAELVSRFLSRWPLVAAASLPVAVAFGVSISWVSGWDVRAAVALSALCVLNGLFAQSLTVNILHREYRWWAFSWAAYSVSVVALPGWWLLPPLVGLITQLGYLAGKRPSMLRLVGTHGLAGHFAKGALIGSVLWSDKLFYFLKSPTHFDPFIVFLSVLPAIVAYNYYFVRLAPRMDALVKDMRTTMETELLARSTRRLRDLGWQVQSLAVTGGCVGVALSFGAVVVISFTRPEESLLYAAMTTTSCCLLLITVLIYKLDYIGSVELVCWLSGVELFVISMVFVFFAPDSTSYLVLGGLSVGVIIATARRSMDVWRVPEYALFWRHATQW